MGSAADLHFIKYTSFGNTFIIVDETRTPLIDDHERATFARWVLNPDFGLGGTDNVLYLSLPDPGEREADFVFRIFEHDGSETLSCGNGLLSTAAVLHRLHGGIRFGVLTELPTGDPQLVHVGVDVSADKTWVNVGWPRATPAELFTRAGPPPVSKIDAVDGLTVPLPTDAPWADGLPDTLTMSGSLVFTGEPHLMLISGHGLPEILEDRLFLPPRDRGAGEIGRPATPQEWASNLLVDHIGRYVNAHYRDRFPQGVHLNFARILDTTGLIESRTYERAIDCETLACGSGSVAMAYMAQTLGLVFGERTEFWPHRCRWYRPDASLGVARAETGWVLTGQPRMVCEGVVPRPSAEPSPWRGHDSHR